MMRGPKQCVILCGGKGNRLLPFTSSVPKPMIPCNGQPFLWHLLNHINEQGIEDFLLLTGYLGHQIKEFFGDGSSWGWKIEYSERPTEWTTAKRIWEVQDKLEENFLLLYCDNFVPFPLNKLIALHDKHHLPLTLMVSEKLPGNIQLDDSGVVTKYERKRSQKLPHVEIGYMIVVKQETLDFFDSLEGSFSEVIASMAKQKKISAWIQHDKYHSVSDPIRWKKTKHYLRAKKIILLDRDGVINVKQKVGEHVVNWKNFKFIPDTLQGLKLLSKEGFKFIVISNQAGIKRGLVDVRDLEEIHTNMIEKLAKEGVEILDIYYCPHFIEDNCNCRKPKPEMFYRAAEDWFLRLDKTIYIGDTLLDTQAAYNAGTKNIFLGDSSDLMELADQQLPLKTFKKLTNAVPFILKHFKKEI